MEWRRGFLRIKKASDLPCHPKRRQPANQPASVGVVCLLYYLPLSFPFLSFPFLSLSLSLYTSSLLNQSTLKLRRSWCNVPVLRKPRMGMIAN